MLQPDPNRLKAAREAGRRIAGSLLERPGSTRFTRAEWAVIVLSLVFASFLVIDPLVLQAARGLDDGTRAFFRSFTDLGKAGWILIPSGAALIGLTIYSRRQYRMREMAAAKLAAQIVGFVFLAVAGTSLAGSLIKNVMGRARPKFFDQVGPVHFEPFSFTYDFASFPSGHATTICAFAAVLAIFWPRARVYLFAAAAWVAASRFLIGSHYFSDVVGGALLGFAGPYYIRGRLAARQWLFEPHDGGVRLRAPLLRSWGMRRVSQSLLPRSDTMAQHEHGDPFDR